MTAQFLAEIHRPVDQIDLERCALLLAANMQSDLDVDACVAEMDAQVNAFLDQRPDYGEIAPFNSAYLVGIMDAILGYSGDGVEYYAPDNSLLNRVIETRLGIPISLAAIYISVGKRLGIDVQGVSFPAHFLIRIIEPDKSETLVDPFSHRILNAAQTKMMIEAARARFGRFDERWLQNTHPHDFLLRMLENLKGAYQRLGDTGGAQNCVTHQLLLRPKDEALMQQQRMFTTLGKAGKGKA